MNKNSTSTGKRIIANLRSTTAKFAVGALSFCYSFLSSTHAQNTDLPNPDANIQTAPVGSLIIAMDNTNQSNPGYFNLKAYGLIVTLMDYDIRLRWIITAGKIKDGADINVDASSATTATVISSSSKMTITAGSNIATLTNVLGPLMVGMSVTATAIGIPPGTTIVSVVDATHIMLSANATATISNKTANYSINTYPVSNYNFKAGPFVIFPADTTAAMAIINSFNNVLAPSDQVNVFRTTTTTSVDVRYDMLGIRPKAALLNDGGNAAIHQAYMLNAAIPTLNYAIFPSAVGLTSNCFTFASEAHNAAQGAFIDSIKSFVMLGGNFLAECHALTAYENYGAGHFISSNGITNTNTNISNNTNYLNSDLSFSQYEGVYTPNIGGNSQTWTFDPGSSPQNNYFGIINGNTAALAGVYGAGAAKFKTGVGGMIYYLGNHSFDGITPEKINGQRIYLNAFLTPAATPACDPALRLLPIKLNYFSAKKISDQQVQIDWSTSTESNVKEFIVERSADAVDFSEIVRVVAKGYSSVETKYRVLDYAPLQGKNFYRFTTLGVDGDKSYTNIVLVKMNSATATASLDIYPNPARNETTVSFTNLPLNNNSIVVTDMTGAVVISMATLNGSSVKLNTSGLEAGMYIVKVISTDGTTMQRKMIVTNR